jgi:riboflavin biosynthesis pyrimidine reductase
LFGGGVLFRSLLDAGLVDTVEMAVMPVLLGAGIPMLAGPAVTAPLELISCEQLPSGIVMLKYGVRPHSA